MGVWWRPLRGVCLLGLLAAGCAHVTNANQALCDGAAPCRYDPAGGYRLTANKRHAHTLVMLTFSGGGLRASALAYGTLAALGKIGGLEGGGSLLDEVDLISSVSGGSVTAGWYALHGKDGLGTGNGLESFLYKGATTELAVDGLNPAALAAYAFTRYQRSDVLAGVFAQRLFGDATYATVEGRYRGLADQPYVILNASDVGHETRFPFTQNRFDLLCSDLARYRLADAVASSADFPIVFTPIGLRNYSRHCAAQDQPLWKTEGPPRWIFPEVDKYEAREATGDAPTPFSNGLLELRLARTAKNYVEPADNDDIVHLMDGGLVDNLGIQSALDLEDEAMCSPGLFQRLAQPRPPAYAPIDNVVVIVVNARSVDPTSIDGTVYPPGLLASLGRVINTPLDSSILDMQNYLTAELEAIAAWTPNAGERPTTLSTRQDCWVDWKATHPGHAAGAAASGAQPGASGAPAGEKLKVHVVSIDFEMIPNKDCRNHFWTMATSWNLDRKSIDDLVRLPFIMLHRSPDLKGAFRDAHAGDPSYRPQSDIPIRQPDAFPSDYTTVCS